MDILIGLHLPTHGTLLIDKNWRTNTSFVPQKVVLFESTVKENIIFGEKYDKNLFERCIYV